MTVQSPRPWGQEETAAIIEKATALHRECQIIQFPSPDVARHLPRPPCEARQITAEEVSDALASPTDFLAFLNGIGDRLATITALIDEATERAAIAEEEPIATPSPANDAAPEAEPAVPEAAPRKARHVERSSRAPSEQEVILEFRRAIEAAGIPVKDDIIANTPRIQRAYVSGDRKGSKNCWYILKIDDGVPAGAFGCHKRHGEKKFKWSMKGAKPLTLEERRELAAKAKAAAERRAAEERELQEKAAKKAQDILSRAKPATDDHEYLKRKDVPAFGVFVGDWPKQWTDEHGEIHFTIPGALLVPMRSPESPDPVNLQAILPSDKELGRNKDFLFGARKQGCWFTIGKSDLDHRLHHAGRLVIVICEGYATAGSIHRATNAVIAVAFDRTNLIHVAQYFRRKEPDAIIVIAADNDQWTAGNPGVTDATAAARAVDGVLAIPAFASVESKPSDFNDLHLARGIERAAEGLEEVQRQIIGAIEAHLRREASRESVADTFDDIASGKVDPPGAGTDGSQANDATNDNETAAHQRPAIEVRAGALSEMATLGERAIIDAGKAVYARGSTLVRPVVEEVEAAHGRRTKVAQLAQIETHYMRDLLCRSADWVKYNARKKENLVADPPYDVAQVILHRHGEWQFPTVAGVITTPTMRPDGSLLLEEGYDKTTRLILMHPPEMPEIPEKPTYDDAKNALALLDGLLDEFPFADAASRSVGLSTLMTPVVRGAFPVTPMHVTSAPTAGSGKSFLLDVAAATAIGQPCPVMSAGESEAETEKRLGAALLAGQPIISIDNVNGDLGGDALCQIIERPIVEIRVLGKSEHVRVEARSTIFATGNNIRMVGDMVRRVLRCRLDSNLERPELRQFRRNPVKAVLSERGKYIAAALTVVRAYVVAGRPDTAPRLASFEGWSDLVRSALIWLGKADPVDTMKAAREEDPQLQTMSAVFSALRDAIGVSADRTVAKMIELACSRFPDYDDQGVTLDRAGEWKHPQLHDALMSVANRGGFINPKVLGNWLGAHKHRIANGVRLDGKSDTHGHAARWWLTEMRSAGAEYAAADRRRPGTGAAQLPSLFVWTGSWRHIS
jgi:phage/plasmid primase-like uncharacterized protein